MTVEELFKKSQTGTLTYDEFQKLAKESNANFTDLGEGKYVSKNKYEDDLKAKDTAIETLNGTISTRDKDLADLKDKLKAAGTDADKLASLTGEFNSLQTKYDSDIKAYQDKLSKQAYEFAVKDFASSKKFTSNAAKRDFINSMIAKELKMDNGKILGADDFVTSYSTENADAFVVEKEDKVPEQPKPSFVSSTQGANPPTDSTGGFASAFHFTGVRPKENNK